MLLVFPVMIWLGVDPKIANATCTVALWPGLFAGLFGYRREMNDSSIFLMRLGAISVVGGGAGAWLLIATPSPVFARLVPVLIFFATILFMVQGPVNRWLRLPAAENESTKRGWTVVIIIQFFSAMYGGYFGAGMGIMVLAMLQLLGMTSIHRMNAVKTILTGVIDVVAVGILQAIHVRVLVMEQHKDFLGQIFCDIPRYTRCREGDDPFTEMGKDGVAFHRAVVRRAVVRRAPRTGRRAVYSASHVHVPPRSRDGPLGRPAATPARLMERRGGRDRLDDR